MMPEATVGDVLATEVVMVMITPCRTGFGETVVVPTENVSWAWARPGQAIRTRTGSRRATRRMSGITLTSRCGGVPDRSLPFPSEQDFCHARSGGRHAIPGRRLAVGGPGTRPGAWRAARATQLL